ncbi:MAG: hypothetical protein ABR924_01370 [Terracidiphilus sp.]|jgi:hypothetical protein
MSFQGLLESAGERSFGAFTYQYPDGVIVFVLQHRALDKGVPTPNYTDSPLSLVTDFQLNFCPQRGANLHRFYRHRLKELDRSDLKVQWI